MSAGESLSIPSVEDDSVAPAGHHTVCITMFAPWARAWKDDKARVAEGLIDEAEKVIPGLRRSIVFEALWRVTWWAVRSHRARPAARHADSRVAVKE